MHRDNVDKICPEGTDSLRVVESLRQYVNVWTVNSDFVALHWHKRMERPKSDAALRQLINVTQVRPPWPRPPRQKKPNNKKAAEQGEKTDSAMCAHIEDEDFFSQLELDLEYQEQLI